MIGTNWLEIQGIGREIFASVFSLLEECLRPGWRFGERNDRISISIHHKIVLPLATYIYPHFDPCYEVIKEFSLTLENN